MCTGSFIFLALLIFTFGSALRIENSGVLPIHRGDILILFYLTVVNDYEDPVHVEARGEHCCDAEDPEDPTACEYMRLTGGHMGQFAAREKRNITLFYITPVPHGRRGRCDVELWFGRPGGDTKALNHRISFDTLVRHGEIPPALVADYYDPSSVENCMTSDLDPLDSCEPVDCRMKYGGARPFFLREQSRCVPAPECSTPDQAYDPADNSCRDLGAGLSEEDERVLRQPGGPPLDANANAPSPYVPLVRCHHGQPDTETGLCLCDEGWGFAPIDSPDTLQPSTFVVHLCTERQECKTFFDVFGIPILLGVATALLVALLSVLAYLCWLRLCATRRSATILEAPICICNAYKDEDEQDDGDSPLDMRDNSYPRGTYVRTTRMVYKSSQDPSTRDSTKPNRFSRPSDSQRGQEGTRPSVYSTLVSLTAPNGDLDPWMSTGNAFEDGSITGPSIRYDSGRRTSDEIKNITSLRSMSTRQDSRRGSSDSRDPNLKMYEIPLSEEKRNSDIGSNDLFDGSKRDKGFGELSSDLRRRESPPENTCHGESLRGLSIREESTPEESRRGLSVPEELRRGSSMRRESMRGLPTYESSTRESSTREESMLGESMRRDSLNRSSTIENSRRGDSMHGDSVRKDSSRGKSMSGELMSGKILREDLSRRESIRAESERGESPIGSSIRRESILGESMRRDSLLRGSTFRDSRRGDSMPLDTMREDSIHGKSVNGESLHEDLDLRESVRTESIRGESPRGSPMRGGSMLRESMRRDSLNRGSTIENSRREDSMTRNSMREDSMGGKSISGELMTSETFRGDWNRKELIQSGSLRQNPKESKGRDSSCSESMPEEPNDLAAEIINSAIRRGEILRVEPDRSKLNSEDYSMRGNDQGNRELMTSEKFQGDWNRKELIRSGSLRQNPNESKRRDSSYLESMPEEPYDLAAEIINSAIRRGELLRVEPDRSKLNSEGYSMRGNDQENREEPRAMSSKWENDIQQGRRESEVESPMASWSPPSSPGRPPTDSSRRNDFEDSRRTSGRDSSSSQVWSVAVEKSNTRRPPCSPGRNSAPPSPCSSPCAPPSPPPCPDSSCSLQDARGRSPTPYCAQDNDEPATAPCRHVQPCVVTSRSPTPPTHHFTFVGPCDTQGPILFPPYSPTGKSSWQPFRGPCPAAAPCSDKRDAGDVLRPCGAYQPDGRSQSGGSCETVWYPSPVAGSFNASSGDVLRLPPCLVQQLDGRPVCTPSVCPGRSPRKEYPRDVCAKEEMRMVKHGDKGVVQVCPELRSSPVCKCGRCAISAPCGLQPCGLQPCGLQPYGLQPCGHKPCVPLPCGHKPCVPVCRAIQPPPPEVTVSAPAGPDSDHVVYLTVRTQSGVTPKSSDVHASAAESPCKSNRGAMTVQLRQTRVLSQGDSFAKCKCPAKLAPCQAQQPAICASSAAAVEKPCVPICAGKSSSRSTTGSCVRDCPMWVTTDDDEFWEQFMPRWRELRSDTDDSR